MRRVGSNFALAVLFAAIVTLFGFVQYGKSADCGCQRCPLQQQQTADAPDDRGVYEYAEGQQLSRETGKPLVLWIGLQPTALPGVITATAPEGFLTGRPKKCVFVSTWVGEDSYGYQWDGRTSVFAVATGIKQAIVRPSVQPLGGCPDGRCPTCPNQRPW